MSLLERWGEPLYVSQVVIALTLAILFLQSGLDKAIDWKGNRAFLGEHFGKSPLKGVVTPMLLTVTVLELLAGALAAVGVVQLVFGLGLDARSGASRVAYWAAVVACLNLVALFFGQRLAKDYAGAGGLVPYLILSVGGLFVLGGAL